jgi:transcriptional regulator with XRE-family HTH domain
MSIRGRPKGSVNIYDPRDLERMKFLGKKYKRRRKQIKKTQTYIAKAIGVTFQQVQKYERGKNAISTFRIEPLRIALDIPAHRVGFIINKYNPKQRNIT